MKIAVSGKGGVGKTTIAANLVSVFAAKGFTVYAVDADPDASLGHALGLPPKELSSLRPVAEMKELVEERIGKGGFYSLNPRVDDIFHKFTLQQGRIIFLRMGEIKQGGTACYCKENTFLHAVMNSLLLDREDMVVMDMGAGIEHLTRGTSRGVDMMIIVTEPAAVSVKTAMNVRKLAQELGVGEIKVIGNKVRNKREEDFIRSRFDDDELLGIMPFSAEVQEAALSDEGLLAGKGVLPGIEEMAQKAVVVLKG